jgi:hypothetical protein
MLVLALLFLHALDLLHSPVASERLSRDEHGPETPPSGGGMRRRVAARLD